MRNRLHFSPLVSGICFLIVLCGIPSESRAAVPDSSFTTHTIEMLPDYEGAVEVTVIEPLEQPAVSHAVLYIHGFNDYFFQQQLADSVVSWNVQFYALDLRKYGRSWLSHQKFNNVRDLSEYFADIDTALAFMQRRGVERVTLIGHSTGGLTAALYAHEHPGNKKICSLALNSPFLDMNMSWFLERMAVPVVAALGEHYPDKLLPIDFPPHYGHSLHYQAKGQWHYNLNWKPHKAPAVNYGWIRAIYLGQQQIKQKLDINWPVLVMHSDSSCQTTEWTDAVFTSDAVLDVADIECYASYLGEHVTTATIPDGIHDLALSRLPARKRYYTLLRSWVLCKF